MKLPVKIAEAMKACRANLSSPFIEYGKPFSEYFTEKVTEQNPQMMRHNICSICHTAVRGPSTWCQVCGHGGHLEHMSAWFKEHDMCPSGCGHVCIHTKKKIAKK